MGTQQCATAQKNCLSKRNTVKLIYCKDCLQPNSRPGTSFDSHGICPACKYHKSLKYVDWNQREEVLRQLIKKYRTQQLNEYDCIIGVSGGKDSLRQALYVKNHLSLNPLLVSIGNPPQMLTQKGADNLSNLVNKGFDLIYINPAPETWRKLMKKAFLKFCNWGKSTEYPLFAAVPKIAIGYKVRLVLWGENPALQLGDLNALGKEGWDGNSVRYGNTLQGGKPTWMLGKQIKRSNIIQYIYPDDNSLERAKIQIVYLGYFWKDWSLLNNANYSVCNGLEIRCGSQKYENANAISSLDTDWVQINQLIKYYKFGFGQVSDFVNQEIRNGNMNRCDGVKIISKYDGEYRKKDVADFCRFIGISEILFWRTVDKFVNRKLFQRTRTGKYAPLFDVGVN